MKTAMRRLASARYLSDGRYYDDAVGRAYYAVYEAAPSAEEGDEAIRKAENFVNAVRREYFPPR